MRDLYFGVLQSFSAQFLEKQRVFGGFWGWVQVGACYRASVAISTIFVGDSSWC